VSLTARAKPKSWIVVVLVPATLGLIWAGVHAATSDTPEQFQGRGSGLLNALSPTGRAIFFLVAAVLCAGALGMALKARLSTANALEIDADGITSRTLGGRGTLAWPAVTHLTRQGAWLYVHGHNPAGRRRKLAVSLIHLDKSSDEIMAAVGAYRPDLSGSRALDAGELPRDLHG